MIIFYFGKLFPLVLNSLNLDKAMYMYHDLINSHLVLHYDVKAVCILSFAAHTFIFTAMSYLFSFTEWWPRIKDFETMVITSILIIPRPGWSLCFFFVTRSSNVDLRTNVFFFLLQNDDQELEDLETIVTTNILGYPQTGFCLCSLFKCGVCISVCYPQLIRWS